MVGILLVILALVFVFSVVMYARNDDDGLVLLSVVSFFLMALTSIVFLLTYSESVSTNATLRAFSAQNRSVYQETVRVTREMVTGNPATPKTGAAMVDGSTWEQAKVASERLKELRDSVAAYNTQLREKREYASHWFLRMWIAEPPAELDYIQIQF
jgi:membrane-bound ClpP family serine protease